MADMKNMQNFEAARKCLKNSLEKSSVIASALDDSGSRLELLNQRCQSLESALRPISMKLCSFADIGESLDSVLCSAAAVLKVFDAVHQLENSLLTDPSSDLYAYILDTKKLEEALMLLSDNCSLSLGWLQDIVEFLQDKAIINELYMSSAWKSLKILQELQAMKEGARLDGAFEKLEIEFQRLLIANTMLLPLASLESESSTGQKVNTPLLPGTVIGKLRAIIERLSANDRLHKCKSIYVEVRSTNARRSLKPLDLSYLEIQTIELGSYVEQWGRHLELAVRHLLEVEYRLCGSVFENIGPEAWMGCFANVAIESGILFFLQFAKRITEGKSDPIKLLKLLDIFRVLNNLRLNFNRLFGGKACEEIRNVTKDLIKRVVDGCCEIFWELPAQVKLQRPSSPPRDGSVPRLVSFVTDYCNQLLSDAYRPHLTQVLEIHLNWRKEIYQEGIIFTQVYNVVKEIAVNLDTWSKAYEDIPLSYLFMMNNHCHFYNLRDTMVGCMMGDSWLRAHEQYKDYYVALYLRESWGKLVSILDQRDLLSSSSGSGSGRLTVQNLVKRLDAFNLAFHERYKKQSNWVISDEILREKVRKHLVEGILPTYRAYVKNYSLSIENDAKAAKHIKYSELSMENMLRSLFQPKLRKYDYGSTKQAHLVGRIKEMSHQFRLTLTAM